MDQAPALCVQAGSTWVCHVGPWAMSTCSESPHLNPKAEVTQLLSCSLHHLKTESLGAGRSFSTTHKDEKCLQFSFFQELPLECDFGRRYFGFFVLHNSRDHKITNASPIPDTTVPLKHRRDRCSSFSSGNDGIIKWKSEIYFYYKPEHRKNIIVHYCLVSQCKLLYNRELKIISRFCTSQIKLELGPAANHRMSKTFSFSVLSQG